MRNKLLLVLFLSSVSLLFSVVAVNENQYIVKAGDTFFVQFPAIDTVTVQVPVLVTGKIMIPLFNITEEIAGLTAAEAKTKLAEKLSEGRKNPPEFVFELAYLSPFSYHLSGAVNMPGEFESEYPLSLYQALMLGKGRVSSASSKITVINGKRKNVYDINKYLLEGDLTQNPVVNSGDVIVVDYAKEVVQVFVNNDTVSVARNFETEPGDKVKNIIAKLSYKGFKLDFNKIIVEHDGVQFKAEEETEVFPEDKIYLSTLDSYVYVIGEVKTPGRIPYKAGKNAQYYVDNAEGYIMESKEFKLYLIRDGKKKKYSGQTLYPGETILVEDDFWAFTSHILKPVGMLASIISTAILVYKNI
ncbi:MAG: hypothetical protein CSB55_04125 [Candidatus Cloacimonadota bacterium]|nr:MAG: hypothetical protein CSB55_04125 [Candidatus Cloacimonadota bacterium]